MKIKCTKKIRLSSLPPIPFSEFAASEIGEEALLTAGVKACLKAREAGWKDEEFDIEFTISTAYTAKKPFYEVKAVAKKF